MSMSFFFLNFFFSFAVVHFLLQMWPDLLKKAKDGGLDIVDTYVFWNGHEPTRGKVIYPPFLSSSCSFLIKFMSV